MIGDNGMLITEKYSSYVFIGEIITDLPLPIEREYNISRCEGCGRCKKACPICDIGECLSALTQKKGELTEEQVGLMKDVNTVWGCDECQKCCPYNKNISLTEIDFFADKRQQKLTKELLDAMSDEEFKQRAYSWRGKKTIERNLEKLGY
jgi:epoxyqueuosine reductase QueG